MHHKFQKLLCTNYSTDLFLITSKNANPADIATKGKVTSNANVCTWLVPATRVMPTNPA